MSKSKTSLTSHKAYLRPSKTQKLTQKLHKEPLNHFSSEIWDKIPKIHLTKNALKELDRRNKGLDTFEFFAHQHLEASPGLVENIRQLAREGGPDLTDLRGYPERSNLTMASGGNQSTRPSRGENWTTTSRGTKTTGPYSINFEEILIYGGIFPETYISPDIRAQRVPGNHEILIQKANEHRRMLASSIMTEDEYLVFRGTLLSRKSEEKVVSLIVPVLEGQFRISNQGFKDTRFVNLAPLVDETVEMPALVKGTPDRCYGAPFERLNERIRRELGRQVVPTKQPYGPIAPNFFLEIKGPEGHEIVANRQALYYGALGERGQISLRSWGHDGPVLDGTAHTISCTFIFGHLTFYSIHAAQCRTPGRQINYFIYVIDGFSLHLDYRRFKKAVAAYQNLQEYAEEMREESIRLANSR
ncbi:hypothetical protein EPUL_006143, partial [Erysiphe pulchra]